MAQTYTFDSFGKLTNSSGSLTNPFHYTARENDTETGLYYYRARCYDPSVGRFVSEDPIRLGGGVNFYAYVFNNVSDKTDPEGLRTRVCCRSVDNVAAGLKKANHCSIAIDGNPAINGGALTVFSLFPANYSVRSDSGVGVPHMNDPSDLAPIIEGVSRCTDVPDCNSCNEQKILQSAAQEGDAGPSQNYHTLWSHNYGPNSNTFVSYTLKKAGCKAPKLPVNAPRYDFPLP